MEFLDASPGLAVAGAGRPFEDVGLISLQFFRANSVIGDDGFSHPLFGGAEAQIAPVGDVEGGLDCTAMAAIHEDRYLSFIPGGMSEIEGAIGAIGQIGVAPATL